MKRISLLAALVLVVASSAFGQSFSMGARYSSYSTDLETAFATLETGREGSVGLLGEYRNGNFVLKGQWDHDLEGGLSFEDILPVDTGDYERDRIEFTAGFAPVPVLDLDFGIRTETVKLDTVGIGGFRFGDEFEHQALVFGARVQTPSIRPIGFYVSARGYVGSADFDIDEFGDFSDGESDTTGFKIEAGIPIPVGLTGWEITPGYEYERIETDDDFRGLELDSNRIFFNFVYNFGGQ